jgi:alpha-mannosidase
MAYRAGPAGPAIATPGAQLVGGHAFELAVYPHAGDWRAGKVHAAWEAFGLPFRAMPARGGPLAPQGSALSIEPDSVELSALHAAPAGVTCRIYNASGDGVTARLRFGEPLRFAAATLVGILGEERAGVACDDDGFVVPLRPWEIATLSLR